MSTINKSVILIFLMFVWSAYADNSISGMYGNNCSDSRINYDNALQIVIYIANGTFTDEYYNNNLLNFEYYTFLDNGKAVNDSTIIGPTLMYSGGKPVLDVENPSYLGALQAPCQHHDFGTCTIGIDENYVDTTGLIYNIALMASLFNLGYDVKFYDYICGDDINTVSASSNCIPFSLTYYNLDMLIDFATAYDIKHNITATYDALTYDKNT